MISELEKAKQLLSTNSNNDITLNEIQNEMGLKEFVEELIKSNYYSTIGIKYELNDVYITCVDGPKKKLEIFNNYSSLEYKDFCEHFLKLDMREQYNCSRTLNIHGVATRVYAMMPPLTEAPNITISTTKVPPATLVKQTISDELFDQIIHDNFIVVGASGSGKTYLTNYLLSKFIRKDERIALIEEFGELISPNDLTLNILVPPPKPGDKSLLKFVTEQSNLMRLDAFYVGEIKGEEAWPFVVNLASGTRGGCTIHGESATQALSRLRALCRLSCDNDDAINEFIAKSVRYIILMKNRNIDSVYKLTGTVIKNNFAMEKIGS